MIKKLLHSSKFTIDPHGRHFRNVAALIMIILYFGSMSQLAAQTAPFTSSEESVSYDFNECRSFEYDGSNYDYSEFTPAYGVSCASATGSQLYRHSGKHSCTDDEAGNAGDAACFQSSLDDSYSADHALAIRFDVTLSGNNGKKARLDGISFKQLAPHNYLWSAEGYTDNTGPNNYPTKYGVRVLKDNQEIFLVSDIPTSQSWDMANYDFTHMADFTVDAGATSVFTFELTSYAPVGNGATVSAWDLDDLKVFTSCEEDCTLTVDAGDDIEACENEPVLLTAVANGAKVCPKITSSYKITDASTEGKSCFPTWGTGVIFQRAAGCQGSHHIWRAGDLLVMNEFDDGTAQITGTVIDQNGTVGDVDIMLYDKANQGSTWNAQCYLAGITDPRTFYQSFNGTITVNGQALTVEQKQGGQHYILADGAGFEAGRFGFGAWTAGSFGGCTEWFGNLEPMQIEDPNEELTYLWSTGETTPTITVTEAGEYTVTVKDCANCTATDTVKVSFTDIDVDAGEDVEACVDDLVELTATAIGTSECPGGCEYPIESAPRCHNPSNLSDVWLNNITDMNKGFVTSSSKFETFDDGTARYTAVGTNGLDNIEVDIRFSGYTTVAPPDSPKENNCGTYDTSDWVYWTHTSGTIKTEQHGTLIVSRSGPSMQMGNGADTTRDGFGASGWLTVTGGDGFYTRGDINLKLGDCIPIEADSSLSYLWTTVDGNIVGNADQKTITVDKPGDYKVTVTDCSGCTADDTVKVTFGDAMVDAGEDQTICIGEEAMLTAEGEGEFLWSTGETAQSIKVSPEVTTEYSVIVTNGECEAMDEVKVYVDDKVVIGDYVWLDENRNGIQDDGNTGINGVSVKLYHCEGELVDSTETANGPDGDGYYEFKVCPGSGDYYIVFGDVPEGHKFTTANEGNDDMDSDADAGGVTDCFTLTDEDDLTIDAGLIEICDITLEVVEEAKICTDETLELTATLIDNTGECEGGCEYPIVEQERCYGPEGDFEIWMVGNVNGSNVYHKFKASEQRFETLDDGSARYTATATDGIDNIKVEALFTGYTTIPGPNGPKPNDCQDYDMSDWEYWSDWSGTITSELHGVFTLSLKGTYFQMGVGADVVRSGFGASGWFYANGGDGYYVDGDINVALEDCIEKNATYKWTTEDGIILGDPYQKTIAVVSPGTYVIEAENCLDCVAVKKVVVTEDILCSSFAKTVRPIMAKVYPIPVNSGGSLTIEFDLEGNSDGLEAISLKAGSRSTPNKENVSIVMYDMMGRVISTPRTFDLYDGKATVHLDVNNLPSGRYIVKAMGGTWSHSKNIIVK